MFIEKEKFILRSWKREDFISLAEHANSKKIWDNVRDYFPYPYTEKDAMDFIDSVYEKSGKLEFTIEIDGKASGGIGFIQGPDVEKLSAELGYWLGEKHWKKGIMTDVVKTAIEYIFKNSDIIRIFATVFEYNKASMRVLEKSGFKKLAIFNRAAVKNNVIIDLHYYELLK